MNCEIPEKRAKKVPEKIAKKVPEKIAKKVPEKIAKKVPEKIAKKIREKIAETVEIPKKIAETAGKAEKKSLREHRKELGTIIASLRKEKKYSLENLSKKTKVPLHALKSIEEGHDDFYKEKLYSRGFLSLICRELKTDPKVFLKKLDCCQEPHSQVPKTLIEKESLRQTKKLRAKAIFGFKSLFLAFLVLLGFSLFYFLMT